MIDSGSSISHSQTFKQQRQNLKSKQKKDRVYHEVEIQRLAKAFEKQFCKNGLLSNYEAVKVVCFKDLSSLQRLFYIWLAIALAATVFLIINLIIYTQKDTLVLIAIVNSISGINSPNDGFLVIPIGIFVLIALMPFLCGRCLSIAATVTFTRKLSVAIKVNGALFIALALFTIIIDCTNYSTVTDAGFAIVLIIVTHIVIAAAACYLMHKTYLKA